MKLAELFVMMIELNAVEINAAKKFVIQLNKIGIVGMPRVSTERTFYSIISLFCLSDEFNILLMSYERSTMDRCSCDVN